MATAPTQFTIKYYPCGSNLPVDKDDLSTWPIYSSDCVPTGGDLQSQLSNYDPSVMPNTPMYLWDAVAHRPSPLRLDATLQPGEVCVLVLVKPEFGAQAQAIASKLDILSNLMETSAKLSNIMETSAKLSNLLETYAKETSAKLSDIETKLKKGGAFAGASCCIC